MFVSAPQNYDAGPSADYRDHVIISHKHKFIFIKTVKTAGTSIEVFLSPHCGPDDVLTPIEPPVSGHQPRNYEGSVSAFREIREHNGLMAALWHGSEKRRKFYRHMPAWIVRSRVSAEVWDGYFKFCVDRNPWDKLLSHYHMQKARQNSALTLDEYLAKGKFPVNYQRYTDPSGSKVIVDRVIKYENLLTELGEVFERLNIPFAGTLGVRAKGEYRSDRTPYQAVFTPEQKQLVERVFAREIELHGYAFDSFGR